MATDFRLDDHVDPKQLDRLVEAYLEDRDLRGSQMANLVSFSQWYEIASDPNAHQATASMAQPAEGALAPSPGAPVCNRTACKAPGAGWWNVSTRAWYCRDCAIAINREVLPGHGPCCINPVNMPPRERVKSDLLNRCVSLISDILEKEVLYLENRGIFTIEGYEKLRHEARAILNKAGGSQCS